GHRVIAVDLPGFGDSHKPLGAPYDAPYFAKAVTALLDELSIDDVDLLGHSMGGRVALELTMHAPERFRRAVFMTPSLPWLRERFWTRLRELSVPSMFIWGAHDGLVPAAFARHVRQTVPDAQHVLLRCGHVPQIERPGDLHNALRRFLRN